MSETKNNLSILLKDLEQDRDFFYKIFMSSALSKHLSSRDTFFDIYFLLRDSIANLDQIVEFEDDNTDISELLKNFEHIVSVLKNHSKQIMKQGGEYENVSKKFSVISESLENNLKKFKMIRLENKNFEKYHPSECVAGVNCHNHLKNHCEQFSHPKRLCIDAELCNKTDSFHFENYEHPDNE
jgi:hypothetical protein